MKALQWCSKPTSRKDQGYLLGEGVTARGAAAAAGRRRRQGLAARLGGQLRQGRRRLPDRGSAARGYNTDTSFSFRSPPFLFPFSFPFVPSFSSPLFPPWSTNYLLPAADWLDNAEEVARYLYL